MIALLLLTTALWGSPQDTLSRSHQAGDSVVGVSRHDGIERRGTAVLGKRP